MNMLTIEHPQPVRAHKRADCAPGHCLAVEYLAALEHARAEVTELEARLKAESLTTVFFAGLAFVACGVGLLLYFFGMN